jgi:Tfp pilus assembly protein FimT
LAVKGRWTPVALPLLLFGAGKSNRYASSLYHLELDSRLAAPGQQTRQPGDKGIMKVTKHLSKPRGAGGFSMVETLTVVAILMAMLAITVPQLISSRRLIRSSSIPREIMSQLRLARQQAMSQRRAITFHYDDSAKSVRLVNHGANSAGTVITGGTNPMTAGSSVMMDVPLTSSGVPASEISYGIPSGLPTGQLGDKTSLTSLTSSKLSVTFQPDGTVVNSSGAPVDFALFFYNPKAPSQTAVAVSVLGSAGRVKSWRFNQNANKYSE